MTETIRLDVTGMTCGGCVRRAETALQAVPGVHAARVNLATARAEVDHTGLGADDLARALSAAGYPAAEADLTLAVEGAHCGACVARIEAALAAVPGVRQAAFNLASGQARVKVWSGAVEMAQLLSALRQAGHDAHPQETPDARDARAAAELGALGRDVLIAAALSLPVVVLAMGGHVWPPFHHWIHHNIGMTNSWLAQFILTSLVLAGPGRRFFRIGLPALARAAPDMNSLVALGTFAAWAYSVTATFAPQLMPEGTVDVYFEAAAVIITLILLGRWLEARARGRASAAIARLAGLQVRHARVRRGDDWQEIAIEALVAGDEIAVPPGARIPTDAEIIEGRSDIDESAVTGEPLPVSRAPGDTVIGGTVNGTGALVLRAVATGSDTMLAQILRAVEEAQGAKLPIQSAVDRVTMIFVPIVLVIAALTMAAWLASGAGLDVALVSAVAVLVVACPCAMGLAVPVSIMVGTGRASELGLLFRRGDALQRLRDVQVVAFDKTGTLTLGRPALVAVASRSGVHETQLLSAVAGLEMSSEHPLARALVSGVTARGLTPASDVSDVRAEAGMGVTGKAGGHQVKVGAARFFDAIPADLQTRATQWESEGRTVVFAGQNGHVLMAMAISDQIRPESAEVIAALRAQGLRTALVTGDSPAAGHAVGDALGIDTVVAGVLPTDKAETIRDLQGAGRVAFVGDGINDAPALAQADVGIALASGTDIAMEAADVVLVSGDLRALLRARRLSTAVMRNIHQNLFWAFAYNVALIPVAAGLFLAFGGPGLSPMLASAAMAASSVLVVGNALRLRRAG